MRLKLIEYSNTTGNAKTELPISDYGAPIYSGGDTSKYERPRVINRTPAATKLSPIERVLKPDIVSVLAAYQQ